MNFTGKLGQYKIIKTEDNTTTLWSEFFDENCHNVSGAYNETLHNYIDGCKIKQQLLSANDVHVLDVGFGLGIGLKALIDITKELAGQIGEKDITYTSIELDEELLKWSLKETFNLEDYIISEHKVSYIVEINKNIQIKVSILIGDGRLTLPLAYQKQKLPLFTAIFQDAFSPKKNPTLWSWQWFSDLYKMSSSNVLLSTYSSSISIRKSLQKSEWIITSSKGFGQKRTMTLASKHGQIDPNLEAELIKSKIVEISDD